jgi:hypothetical protein
MLVRLYIKFHTLEVGESGMMYQRLGITTAARDLLCLVDHRYGQ